MYLFTHLVFLILSKHNIAYGLCPDIKTVEVALQSHTLFGKILLYILKS